MHAQGIFIVFAPSDNTTGAAPVDAFNDVSISEDGNLLAEVLTETSHVEAASQDKLHQDEVDNDSEPNSTTIVKPLIVTVSAVNQSGPDTHEVGLGEREDHEFDEDDFLSAGEEVDKQENTGDF